MDTVLLFTAALITGITASMGLGGGFILVIYLTAIAGLPQMEAQAVNLFFFLPIAAFSLIFHCRKKMVDKEAILPSILPEIPGVFLGVWLTGLLGGEWLSKLFAGFVLFVGIRELIMVFRKPKK